MILCSAYVSTRTHSNTWGEDHTVKNAMSFGCLTVRMCSLHRGIKTHVKTSFGTLLDCEPKGLA